eukprot:TRINITY_DN34147_c0_g3_i1.p1 TRINITY_DN34147_c0_g3~~TRINITY_DN34147_c0_g3_i1.p1  ORF type:complete len:1267 (+),score=355.07 TRINITY_DN34147_c0_g3_i1:170-3970(+)
MPTVKPNKLGDPDLEWVRGKSVPIPTLMKRFRSFRDCLTMLECTDALIKDGDTCRFVTFLSQMAVLFFNSQATDHLLCLMLVARMRGMDFDESFLTRKTSKYIHLKPPEPPTGLPPHSSYCFNRMLKDSQTVIFGAKGMEDMFGITDMRRKITVGLPLQLRTMIVDDDEGDKFYALYAAGIARLFCSQLKSITIKGRVKVQFVEGLIKDVMLTFTIVMNQDPQSMTHCEFWMTFTPVDKLAQIANGSTGQSSFPLYNSVNQSFIPVNQLNSIHLSTGVKDILAKNKHAFDGIVVNGVVNTEYIQGQQQQQQQHQLANSSYSEQQQQHQQLMTSNLVAGSNGRIASNCGSFIATTSTGARVTYNTQQSNTLSSPTTATRTLPTKKVKPKGKSSSKASNGFDPNFNRNKDGSILQFQHLQSLAKTSHHLHGSARPQSSAADIYHSTANRILVNGTAINSNMSYAVSAPTATSTGGTFTSQMSGNNGQISVNRTAMNTSMNHMTPAPITTTTTTAAMFPSQMSTNMNTKNNNNSFMTSSKFGDNSSVFMNNDAVLGAMDSHPNSRKRKRADSIESDIRVTASNHHGIPSRKDKEALGIITDSSCIIPDRPWRTCDPVMRKAELIVSAAEESTGIIDADSFTKSALFKRAPYVRVTAETCDVYQQYTSEIFTNINPSPQKRWFCMRDAMISAMVQSNPSLSRDAVAKILFPPIQVGPNEDTSPPKFHREPIVISGQSIIPRGKADKDNKKNNSNESSTPDVTENNSERSSPENFVSEMLEIDNNNNNNSEDLLAIEEQPDDFIPPFVFGAFAPAPVKEIPQYIHTHAAKRKRDNEMIECHNSPPETVQTEVKRKKIYSGSRISTIGSGHNKQLQTQTQRIVSNATSTTAPHQPNSHVQPNIKMPKFPSPKVNNNSLKGSSISIGGGKTNVLDNIRLLTAFLDGDYVSQHGKYQGQQHHQQQQQKQQQQHQQNQQHYQKNKFSFQTQSQLEKQHQQQFSPPPFPEQTLPQQTVLQQTQTLPQQTNNHLPLPGSTMNNGNKADIMDNVEFHVVGDNSTLAKVSSLSDLSTALSTPGQNDTPDSGFGDGKVTTSAFDSPFMFESQNKSMDMNRNADSIGFTLDDNNFDQQNPSQKQYTLNSANQPLQHAHPGQIDPFGSSSNPTSGSSTIPSVGSYLISSSPNLNPLPGTSDSILSSFCPGTTQNTDGDQFLVDGNVDMNSDSNTFSFVQSTSSSSPFGSNEIVPPDLDNFQVPNPQSSTFPSGYNMSLIEEP